MVALGLLGTLILVTIFFLWKRRLGRFLQIQSHIAVAIPLDNSNTSIDISGHHWGNDGMCLPQRGLWGELKHPLITQFGFTYTLYLMFYNLTLSQNG